VITLSDSSGYIFDEAGLDAEKLAEIKHLKNVRRGRISEYTEKYPNAVYTPVDPDLDHNPLWSHPADCAFPCATQNEINETDARHLVAGGVHLVCEGANMPTTPEAIDVLLDAGALYAPGKAANAGGVAVSGLEMTQNSQRLNWTRQEVDDRLKMIMKSIHDSCRAAAERCAKPNNYLVGANVAGFIKVADAMLDQGLV
jgi:glutamate dehydrogenase (NADP+)